ncbi:MAG: hypothetical protein V1824_03105, partial [archaeon]
MKSNKLMAVVFLVFVMIISNLGIINAEKQNYELNYELKHNGQSYPVDVFILDMYGLDKDIGINFVIKSEEDLGFLIVEYKIYNYNQDIKLTDLNYSGNVIKSGILKKFNKVNTKDVETDVKNTWSTIIKNDLPLGKYFIQIIASENIECCPTPNGPCNCGESPKSFIGNYSFVVFDEELEVFNYLSERLNGKESLIKLYLPVALNPSNSKKSDFKELLTDVGVVYEKELFYFKAEVIYDSEKGNLPSDELAYQIIIPKNNIDIKSESAESDEFVNFIKKGYIKPQE